MVVRDHHNSRAKIPNANRPSDRLRDAVESGKVLVTQHAPSDRGRHARSLNGQTLCGLGSPVSQNNLIAIDPWQYNDRLACDRCRNHPDYPDRAESATADASEVDCDPFGVFD